MGNTSTIQIEIQVDGKGGIKVLRQIGTESEKTGKKGQKGFRAMDRSAKSFNARLSSVHRLLLSLGVGYAIVRTAREMIDLTGVASDLNETISKSRAIFGDVSSDIEAWAAKSAVAIGLSTQAALEHTATLGNMYQQLGAGVDIAEQSSRAMVKLAADLASFHNVAGGASEVLLAMQSAFRGEYDALQRYIPTINAAAVQERALAMAHKTSAKELTNLEKALAAQAIIVRDAGAAVGDFARTSGELANQKRILAAQIENVSARLGEKLLPIVTDVTREINAFIESLTEEDLRLAAETITMIAQSFIGLGKAVAAVPSFIMKVAGAMETEVTVLTDVNEIVEANIKSHEKLKALLAEPITTPSIDKKKIIPPPGPDAQALKDHKALMKEVEKAQKEFQDALIIPSGTYETMEQQLRRGIGADITIRDAEKIKEAYAAMYEYLQFEADGYYDWRLGQIRQETDAYAAATGDQVMAHQMYIEKIKELDKERMDAAGKNNQYLIDLSQRTADAIEDNFSSFFRDFFRGELDSAEDYFRAFCHSLTDSFSDMLGQMTKEMLFGGGSSGSSGALSSVLKWGASAFLGGGTSLDANAGLGADWAGTLWHKGGIVGTDTAPTRYVPASMFAHAPRLHKGLAPDEFPAILQRGETVFPKGQSVSQVKNLTISVPVTIEGQGDDRLASILSQEMEETAKRVMREEMR